MIIEMNWSETKFNAKDVTYIVSIFIMGTFAWASLSIGQANTRDDVAEIRSTQIENTKKNDLRWGIMETRMSTTEVQLKLLEQKQALTDEAIKELRRNK